MRGGGGGEEEASSVEMEFDALFSSASVQEGDEEVDSGGGGGGGGGGEQILSGKKECLSGERETEGEREGHDADTCRTRSPCQPQQKPFLRDLERRKCHKSGSHSTQSSFQPRLGRGLAPGSVLDFDKAPSPAQRRAAVAKVQREWRGRGKSWVGGAYAPQAAVLSPLNSTVLFSCSGRQLPF